MHHVNDDDNVVAFHRWQDGGPGDDVVVIVNFGNRAYDTYRIGFPRPGSWAVRFNSDWRGYSPDFGDHLGYDTVTDPWSADGLRDSANVGLGPYAALILSQPTS